MAREEKLLKLFEQNWSERSIFKKAKDPLNLSEETEEKKCEEEEEEDVKSFLVERAMSDETMKTSLFGSSSDDLLFLSPRSVLNVKPTKQQQLQTILSGKEVREFSSSSEKEEEQRRIKKESNVIRRRRTRRGKSMSDLEYEELKGFMDLGFVFSEEDHKDSDLVSILPGLQRLVKKVNQETEQDVEKRARPYLSEVWDHCHGGGGRKGKTPAIKLKVPATDVDFKDHLKLWAHTVASTIR